MFSLGAVLMRSRFKSLISPTATLPCHTKTCPAGKPSRCPPSSPEETDTRKACAAAGAGPGKSASGTQLVRVPPGKVRLAFIPDNWFTFFYPKTGVSGPYVFLIGLTNYLLSKEIYVMEHEYYSGLSWLVIIAVVVNKMGDGIGASLDKQVEEVVTQWESGRKSEMAGYENDIKMAKDAQMRALGQKLLMDAKKENVLMQLEAVYRERVMLVYRGVRGRMDYHVKRQRAEMRIHQKWMIKWILENVGKSITADLQKQALSSAIADLAAAAKGRA